MVQPRLASTDCDEAPEAQRGGWGWGTASQTPSSLTWEGRLQAEDAEEGTNGHSYLGGEKLGF